MIKEDIVRNIMHKMDVDRKQAKVLVEMTLETMKQSLSGKKKIVFSGFGQFQVRFKNARVGRNPKTKVNFEISERNVIAFYPSKVLRKELN